MARYAAKVVGGGKPERTMAEKPDLEAAVAQTGNQSPEYGPPVDLRETFRNGLGKR